ncbi:HBL/NHE enterotoxin family protein [Streptomyces massasporeus]|uniref:HBL/NHE enterotoxin family protein n=1 Tax=Streptomyces massasporeus TaxID=67324 RepID=A0ABW6LMB4_9ACTN
MTTTDIAAAFEQQQKITDSAAGQGTLSALVQAYSLGVMQQPRPDFSSIQNDKVRALQGGIQRELDQAAENARTYLYVVLPASHAVLSKVENYFTMQGAITEILKEVDDPRQLAGLLRALREEVGGFMDAAKGLTSDMNKMVSAFSDNKKHFADYAKDLNEAVSGQEGAVADLQRQLDDVNARITANTVGATVSGAAILGGTAMILIGCCTSIFGGVGVGVAIGGAALLLGGTGGQIGTGIALANLYDEKRDLLARKQRMEDGVKLLTTCSAGLDDLGKQAGAVAGAAQNVTNGWTFLKGSLNSVADNIEKAGRTEARALRDFYLRSAENSVPGLLEKVHGVQRGLSGVQPVTQPNTHTGDLIREALKKAPQAVG